VVKRIKYPSGLEVAFREFKARKGASIGIMIKQGARTEPLKHKGIAHYLEHLVFKGTKNYSYKNIKQEVEGRGGQLNGYTSQEVTCFYANTLDKNSHLALDVLSDMVAQPLLKKEYVQTERGVILEEIRMYRDLPSSRVSSILDSLLWEGHPLGMDIIGKEQTVKRISRDDLRRFKNIFYRPSNIVVVICASHMPINFEKKILKKFSYNPRKSGIGRFPKAKVTGGFGFKQEVTAFGQSHLSLGFPGYSSFDRRKFVLELINIILGANMSSRLFEQIREKRGLAYEVSTSIKKFIDTGAFIIHCGLDERNVDLAFKLIIKGLEKIKRSLVSKNELARAKDYFLGNFSIHLESTSQSLFYVGESICRLGRVLDYGDIEKEIIRITPQDIRDIAREVFRYNKIKIAIVTNRKRSHLAFFKKVAGSC